MSVCAQIISSLVRKVLSMAKTHMSLGLPKGTLVSAALNYICLWPVLSWFQMFTNYTLCLESVC